MCRESTPRFGAIVFCCVAIPRGTKGVDLALPPAPPARTPRIHQGTYGAFACLLPGCDKRFPNRKLLKDHKDANHAPFRIVAEDVREARASCRRFARSHSLVHCWHVCVCVYVHAGT